MNAVGIDTSKGKSMVTILRPFGEIVSSPHEVKHTSDQIDGLIYEYIIIHFLRFNMIYTFNFSQ